jgi:pimeloyl-ACP methyl ester carboxylesterase
MRSRWLKKTVKVLALLFVALIACGFVYERIGRSKFRRRIPQIGRSVDVGGRTLNISCAGTGSPAVLFESGGDGPGLSWEQTQAEVSKYTQACWYDRAGIGWSDSGPYPRTSAAIANDLHELLKRAGVAPPYVLAGGSFGGLNSRVFGGLYPKDTAGLVLIDSAHEDEPLRAPRFYLARTAPRALWHPLHFLFATAAQVGLIRIAESSLVGNKTEAQMTREEIIDELRRQPKSVVNNVASGVVMPESYAEARSVRPIGDQPVIVLTAGKSPDFGDAELNKQAEVYQQIWIHEIQPKLAKLSSRGRQIVVPNSTHGTIPQEVILSAIRDVVTEVRQNAAIPLAH